MIDRDTIIEALRECQPCTWEDLISHLKSHYSEVDDLRRIRSILADLIREGIVEKTPDYERRKLLYRLK